MIPEDKKSFILHADYENYYSLLESDTERVKWTRVAFAFQNNDEIKSKEIVKTMLPATRMFWEFTKANFERDNQKWENKKQEQEAYREKKRLQKEEERKRKREEIENVATSRQMSPLVANSRRRSQVVDSVADINVNTNDNININNNIKGTVKVKEKETETVKGKVGSMSENLTNQEKLEKFKKEFPKIVIDTEFKNEHDISVLSKAIKESSSFLNNSDNSFSLSLILNNYGKIISGAWKDFATFKKSNKIQRADFKGRDNSKTNFNYLYDNIDEIEV